MPHIKKGDRGLPPLLSDHVKQISWINIAQAWEKQVLLTDLKNYKLSFSIHCTLLWSIGLFPCSFFLLDCTTLCFKTWRYCYFFLWMYLFLLFNCFFFSGNHRRITAHEMSPEPKELFFPVSQGPFELIRSLFSLLCPFSLSHSLNICVCLKVHLLRKAIDMYIYKYTHI